MGRFRVPGPLGPLRYTTPSGTLHELNLTPLGEWLVLGNYRQVSADDIADPKYLSATLGATSKGLTFKASDFKLSGKTIDGTPPDKSNEPENEARVLLADPTLFLGTDGKLSGTASIVIEDSYPKNYGESLRLPVTLRGTDLSKAEFEGDISMGGAMRMDFELKLHYDTRRVAGGILGKLARDRDVGGALSAATTELTHPGFDLSGVMELAVIKKIPLLRNILRTKIEASAPTTKPLDHPLPGAAFRFPYQYSLRGLIPVPPGGILSTASPGLGYTSSRSGANSGGAFSLAGLAVPSIAAMTAGNLKQSFTGYLYMEYYKVSRVSDGLTLGLRLTMAYSGSQSAPKPGTSQDLFRDSSYQPWRPSTRENVAPEQAKPWLMLRLEGTFE